MVEIFGPRERDALRKAARCAARSVAAVEAQLSAGWTTADIDALVARDTHAQGARSSQQGHEGFPASCCTSVNDVVCHGIPSPRVRLRDGDIVNVDVTSELGGFHGDTSKTLFVGTPSQEARHVVEVARRCLYAGIAVVRPGARLGDIGAAIQAEAAGGGCSVVVGYGGHGIGRRMHQEPFVSHVGKRGTGPRIVAGMCFTIEPMVNLGGPEVIVDDDGWTVRTRDGAWSAQFEHTVFVTESGVEVLTAL